MRSLVLIPTALLVAAVGCGVLGGEDPTGEPDTQADEIRGMERKAIGDPRAYVAESPALSEQDEERLKNSKKARRELGWKVLRKVLQPVDIAEQKAIDAGVGTNKIPLFRTWLGGDEFEGMFGKMLLDIGKERRLAFDGATPEEAKALLAWNSTALAGSSEADYFRRLGRITNQQGVDGLGGNARMAYSPAYVSKYFTDWGSVVGCEDKLESLAVETPAPSKENFTNCFKSEFSTDTAVIKTSWRRNDDTLHGIPDHDTTPSTLRKRLSGTFEKGAWPNSSSTAVPLVDAGPDKIYTVKLDAQQKYSLAAMHVMTKELRHWVWVTIWWSSKPSRDFGQDRPKDFATAVGGVWSNYKMCVVTAFDEGDTDPRGGFSGSLGDALAATHGTSSWCSNPFIERGDHNAETNCIGCHQHAGDPKSLATILGRPLAGRTKIREAHPADYSWAFMTPDSPSPQDRFLRKTASLWHAYDGERLPQ